MKSVNKQTKTDARPSAPTTPAPSVVAQVITRRFAHERDTKTKVRFAEIVPAGESEVIGPLYVTKEACGAHREVLVTINIIAR